MRNIIVNILLIITVTGLIGAEDGIRCKYCGCELVPLDQEKTGIEFDEGNICTYPKCQAAYIDGVWYTKEDWNSVVEKALKGKAKIIENEIEKQVKINQEIRRENRIRELIQKYNWTRKRTERIIEGFIYIGDTKEIVREAWGVPKSISRTITGYGTYEQWVYGLGYYVYFENGKVTGIQD